MKSPISFRPKAVFACLGAVIAACLLAGCVKKPSATLTRIDSEFLNPPNDCRIVQYGGHDGSIVPIGKMREYGIGGVVLFMSTHKYLRNEEAWAAMITNIREAKKAGMQVWVADDNGYPSAQAGGLVVAADPKFELRVLAQLSQRGNGPQPVRRGTYRYPGTGGMREGSDMTGGRGTNPDGTVCRNMFKSHWHRQLAFR